ncbi:hypothetical protein LOK49_LG09G01580 [Camellia lanceoleosa]|uniref:Uncharacterized protein n=1 Tax=Camellia lanceoleosa TaxID=1840588 RepID=A0ACC0GJ50_9ERIC|nr:hypothetical protein LOK49_LG09G01580 [Camellia lanceoleosa]
MVQDSCAGDDEGKGEVHNFVTKRVGEFYSVALTKNHQQADTGTNMIHKGKNTRSRIVSKGILAGNSRNCYRGLVQVQSSADDAQNFLQCDSMLIGDNAAANTYPYIQENFFELLRDNDERHDMKYIDRLILNLDIQVKNRRANIEHEASISKIGDDQLFYFEQRGIESEKDMAAMISGFGRDVFNELPDEFCTEVKQLMNSKVEGSVG